MANNRQIPPLTEKAFKAFLRARKDFDYEKTPAYYAVIEQQILKRAPPFLKCIADANPDEVKKFLEKCPELAVMARGTVITVSGYTYENVSAVQLAYLMDDVEICNMMLPYIKELSEDMRKKAGEELAQKMEEVEKQRAEFKPYNFSAIVEAITGDLQLRETGQPGRPTEEVLAKFKEDLKPGIIREGKSWIKEHFQEGFFVYEQNWKSLNENQLRWYLINVIGHMETLAEKCFEQECSQGLKEIVYEKKPSRRASAIKNYINNLPHYMNGLPLTYRGSHDSSLLLGRDFFVEIYFGRGRTASWHWGGEVALKICVKQKDQEWKNLSSSLTSNNQHTKRL